MSDNFARIQENFRKHFKETLTIFEEIWCKFRAGKM